MNELPPHAPTPELPPARSWWREGLRSAFFLAPRWQGLHATPALVFALCMATIVLDVVSQRLYLVGSARFYWPALVTGWFTTVVAIGACWWLAPRAGEGAPDGARAPSGPALFAMFLAQWVSAGVLVSLLLVPLVRQGALKPTLWQGWGQWLAWTVPLAWFAAMVSVLLWRGGSGSRTRRGAAAAAVVVAMIVTTFGSPIEPWYPGASDADSASQSPRFEWTPALLESQMKTLPQRLASIAPQRAGVVDVYAVTFAPYAGQDVFLRESRLVTSVIEERFGARDRSVMLVNHESTAADWPWATPANLERAIAKMAERMDRDEDVLFLHLTSHGARSGELSTTFWPIKVGALTPAALKGALDAAGVRHRVISVSACYSGSWIPALADEHTLVMTAADAEHTSFGCGRGSELTYFGRAMYDEALRKTWSFEAALATARVEIEKREKEAGKDDGFSNPQIHVGGAIRERLGLLERQRAAMAK